MLKSISVEGYRGIRSLAIHDLCRVNVLVGENGTGKTSLLEVLRILVSPVQSRAMWSALARRDEWVPAPEERRFPDAAAPHLFYGHTCELGQAFRATGIDNAGRAMSVQVSVVPRPQDGPEQTALPTEMIDDPDRPLALQVTSDESSPKKVIPLSRECGMSQDEVVRRSPREPDESPPVVFVGAGDEEDFRSSVRSLASMWDRILMTPEEPLAVQALQVVEPRVERVATLSSAGSRWPGAVLVKLQGSERGMPLGSLGAGARRLLVLAVNLVGCRGGYLLVDEIDTGLHYSVMVDAWRMVLAIARRLAVQVFATTHSLDCLHAVGRLYEEEHEAGGDVAVLRLDRGGGVTRYSPSEILVASRERIEVRGGVGRRP